MSTSASTKKPVLDPSRPFTRQAALAAGLSRRALTGDRYRVIHPGVYVAADIEMTPAVRAAAALVPFDASSFASHATAARIWELPIPSLPDEHVTVVEQRHRRHRAGIVSHLHWKVADDDPPSHRAEVRVVDDVRVSSVRQTFVDLATTLDLVDLVVVGDHLVGKHRMVGLRDLRTFAESSLAPGAARARKALVYVREGVDSPMETRLRMLIALAGLPDPKVNALVGDEDELAFRKYDLCWPEVKLIVEYDGRHHVEREEQWESDLRRREAIDDGGWRILVFTANDIYKTPADTLARIHRALLQRGHPKVSARLKPGWERHFPGRP